jgi:hypothetical protein
MFSNSVFDSGRLLSKSREGLSYALHLALYVLRPPKNDSAIMRRDIAFSECATLGRRFQPCCADEHWALQSRSREVLVRRGNPSSVSFDKNHESTQVSTTNRGAERHD